MKELYDLYLEINSILNQRPSNEYVTAFNETKRAIEDSISLLEHPQFNLNADE